MSTKLPGFIAMAVVSGISYAALVSPGTAKGKDNWLTEQAFKRAQQQDIEGQGGSSEDGFSTFDNGQQTLESPQLFVPGRKAGRTFGFRSLYDEEWPSQEPQVFTPRRHAVAAVAEDEELDPEPDQSVGTLKSPDAGFDTYRQPKLVALMDPNLNPEAPSDPIAQAVLQQLREGNGAPNVTEQQRDMIIRFYRLAEFRPLWVTPQGISDKAKAALSQLAKAEDDGLNPEDYVPPRLAAIGENDPAAPNDLATLASLEIDLTAVTVKYAQQLYGGRIIPNRLSGYYDLKPPALNIIQLLYVLSKQDAPQNYLASLAPPHPAYAIMKAALARLRADQTREVPIPEGERVKPGERSSRVPIVRERMVKRGYLRDDEALGWMLGHTADESIPIGEYESVLDKELSKALKAFQKDNDIKQTGNIDQATVDALNGPSKEQSVAKLILNMERMRWLPRDLGRRHIMVNEAAYELQLVDGNSVTWTTKVIVGKPKTQTYVFSDQMETVVLNPYWNVPKSIVSHEMLPRLSEDPYYLDDNGYEVLDAQGQHISSAAVDWWSYGDVIPFDVRQPPGNENALGRIKFLFPNSHDIYMHDTPAKKLFAKATRAFSHGCIRVEDPRKLAEYVLGWDRSRIDEAIASGQNADVKLTTPLPVHLNYFTAWPDANGNIAYFTDIYKRDARLEKALSTVAVASN
jgi:murein L,D-transpeptidase YcbB/YkuD